MAIKQPIPMMTSIAQQVLLIQMAPAFLKPMMETTA